ncbi:hypothetical protein L602_004000000260 [Cupriavidus gilardii J11]|uniref:Uncharacterized protein n=1 Tax=Cupriavidus gilardii J11 TaxID=936133 RepID=A0A562B8Y0_9BURK|nr:hypothetical protein [Cupriavidus gilardii]TWG81488.1 hypothetical protein L602_004000000260 [Cupriavidus gilardii J11]
MNDQTDKTREQTNTTVAKEDAKGPLPGKPRENPGTIRQKSGGEPLPRQPHERDESHQSQQTGSRPVGRQAASDIERGLEETDLYGSRGQRRGSSPGGTEEDND